MRQVSQSALQGMLAEETSEMYAVLLKVDHSSMTEPLRFIQDYQDLTRSDGEYIGFPFEIGFPSDSENESPKVNLIVDNVDQRLIKVLRDIDTKPSITISLVLRSSPETVEMGPFTMYLKNVDYDKFQIRGRISYDEDFLNKNLLRYTFNPQSAAGMFA